MAKDTKPPKKTKPEQRKAARAKLGAEFSRVGIPQERILDALDAYLES